MLPIMKSEPTARGAPPKTDDDRWEAVRNRVHAVDGAFVYAVRTTGVYCRPSCAARLPRRENVTFHAGCREAERAGFRACKRCRPNEAALPERHAATVAKACRMIEEAEESPSLGALAAAAGMSPSHFHRLFREAVGVTPKAYADAARGRRVRECLAKDRTVTEAIYAAGFNSSGRFYAASSGLIGMKPGEFRAGGEHAVVRFALGQCWLGAILVAATQKGVCAIEIGDDPEALLRGFQDRFPGAQLIGADPEFEGLVAQVVGFVEAPHRDSGLPLDIRGTAFQQQVWRALCEIRPGTTASYAEIARRIGRPKATRAVAAACAANALAVAIPCHRVIRTDGAVSGYRWGVARKRKLLEREGAQ